MADGRFFNNWVNEVLGFTEKSRHNKTFIQDLELLKQAILNVKEIADLYKTLFRADEVEFIPLTATRFLESCAEVAIASLMLEQAMIAQRKLSELENSHIDINFYKGKIASAQYYVRNVMTNVFSRSRTIKLKDRSALDIPEGGL